MLEAIQDVSYPMHTILHNAGIDDAVITHWSRLVSQHLRIFSTASKRKLTLPISTKDSMNYIINVLVCDVEENLPLLHDF
ncbi:MAG: hypothetical protein CM15mP49_07310 [Actinomycetota bacterium]|nr:MAG: hypothetical protein CM15mP49_07310 [Actinomycetota bacterium]